MQASQKVLGEGAQDTPTGRERGTTEMGLNPKLA